MPKKIILVLILLVAAAFGQTTVNNVPEKSQAFEPYLQPPAPALAGLYVTVRFGSVWVSGNPVTIPSPPQTAVRLGVVANTINYIYVDLVQNQILVNQSGFSGTIYPVAIVTTNGYEVINLNDVRPDVFGGGGGGSGTITGVTTASGSGLQGGGTTGTLPLALIPCPLAQTLSEQISGWGCAAVGTGNVSTAPPADQPIIQPAPAGVTSVFSANNFSNIRYVTPSWNWSYTDSGGSLGNLTTAGTLLTLTLPCSSSIPCPVGLDTGSAAHHYVYSVYISGTGTPEAALVTGGTCTSAATSPCTVVVTTVNNHPNGYTVGSASSGIQEAWNDAWVNDTGAAPVNYSDPAPDVKLMANVTYNVYSSVYLRGRGGIFDGGGSLIDCQTRDRCIYVGTNQGFPFVHHHKLYNLTMTTPTQVNGVNVSSVTAASGTYTVTTSSAHPFLVGDTVICEYHSQNAEQKWMSPVLTAADNTHFTVAFGSTTFSASATTFGWCNIENTAIEDNSDHVVIQDINLMQVTGIAGTFNEGIVVDNDQQLQIERAANRSTGVINDATSTWPVGSFFYQRTDQGMAGILYLHDSEFSNINCMDGGGNGLVVENTVCQSFPTWGFRYLAGLEPATISSVYEESTGSTTNPLYGYAAQAGYVLGSSVSGDRIAGTWPISGFTPTFTTSGGSGACTVSQYFVIPQSSISGRGPVLYIGQSNASNCNGGTINLQWPSIALQSLNSSLGTVTYDILRTIGSTTVAPFGTLAGGAGQSGSIAVGNSGSCTNGMCSFSDNQSASSGYTVGSQQFVPVAWFWPGDLVINSGPIFVDTATTNGDTYVSMLGTAGVSVVAARCLATGTVGQRSPVWVQCGASSGDSGSGIVSQVLQQLDRAGGGPTANSKGRVNLGKAVTAPNDLITLQDANLPKTLATGGSRPSNDAGDMALGIDQSNGLSIRAATSISNYINLVPDNASYLERLTSGLKLFTVPVKNSANSAASTPSLLLSGTPFTGGSGTTTVPQFYLNSGASAPSTWSTSGTIFGVNMVSAFAGNVFDLHANGGGSLLNITAAGNMTAQGLTAGNITDTGSTAHYVAIGEGSNPFNFISPSSSGLCFLSNGTSADPTFQNCPTGFTNPMTTAGDSIIGTTSGAALRVAGPTGPNSVPEIWTSTPSGGVAGAQAWLIPGISGRAVTGTTSTDTILNTDCSNRVQYSGSVSVAVALPTASTLAVPACVFKVANETSGSNTTVTITPATWTINGASTLVVAKGQVATVYVDPSAGLSWNSDANESGLTASTGITFTRGPQGLTISASGAGVSSVTGDGSLITNSASTGAVTLTLGTSSANTLWGNPTGSTATPIYFGVSAPLAFSSSLLGCATCVTSASGLTAHAPIVGGGSQASNTIASAGTSGQALLSGGSSADPAYGAMNLAGGSGIFTGLLPSANIAAALSSQTSINGLGITASTGTLTIANGKTATFNNSITFSGTDATTMTFPGTSQSIPGLAQGQTFSGANIFSQAVTFGLTSNQNIFGTSTNLTTVTWPASSGGVTVTGPNVTSGLAYVAGSAPSAGVAHFAGSTFALTSSAIVAADITSGTITGTQIASSIALAGSPTTTTQSAKDNSTKIATTAYVDAATGLTTGTSVTLTAPRQYFVCTSTCTITVPVPAAGYEFCVMNDDNVATVITLSAIGSSARYENTARTAYGTAGTGTFVSGGAAADKVCLLGRDSTHYLTASFNGTWTAN